MLSYAETSKTYSIYTNHTEMVLVSVFSCGSEQVLTSQRSECSFEMAAVSQMTRRYTEEAAHSCQHVLYVRSVIQSELLLVLSVQVFDAYTCSDCIPLFSSGLFDMHICLMLDSFVVLSSWKQNF